MINSRSLRDSETKQWTVLGICPPVPTSGIFLPQAHYFCLGPFPASRKSSGHETKEANNGKFQIPRSKIPLHASSAFWGCEEQWGSPTNYLTSTVATVFCSGHFVKVTRTQVHGSAELLQKEEAYTMDFVIKLFTSTLCCRSLCKRIISLQFHELHCSKCPFCEISGRNWAAHKAHWKMFLYVSMHKCLHLEWDLHTHRMEQKIGYYLIKNMKNQQHLTNPPAQY